MSLPGCYLPVRCHLLHLAIPSCVLSTLLSTPHVLAIAVAHHQQPYPRYASLQPRSTRSQKSMLLKWRLPTSGLETESPLKLVWIWRIWRLARYLPWWMPFDLDNQTFVQIIGRSVHRSKCGQAYCHENCELGINYSRILDWPCP